MNQTTDVCIKIFDHVQNIDVLKLSICTQTHRTERVLFAVIRLSAIAYEHTTQSCEQIFESEWNYY